MFNSPFRSVPFRITHTHARPVGPLAQFTHFDSSSCVFCVKKKKKTNIINEWLMNQYTAAAAAVEDGSHMLFGGCERVREEEEEEEEEFESRVVAPLFFACRLVVS